MLCISKFPFEYLQEKSPLCDILHFGLILISKMKTTLCACIGQQSKFHDGIQTYPSAANFHPSTTKCTFLLLFRSIFRALYLVFRWFFEVLITLQCFVHVKSDQVKLTQAYVYPVSFNCDWSFVKMEVYLSFTCSDFIKTDAIKLLKFKLKIFCFT